VVDQDLTHDLRRYSHEMGSTVVIRLILIHQPHIGFVDQGRRLQSVGGALVAHVPPREFPEFGVQQRHQTIKRSSIASGEVPQETRDGLIVRQFRQLFSLILLSEKGKPRACVPQARSGAPINHSSLLKVNHVYSLDADVKLETGEHRVSSATLLWPNRTTTER